MAAQVRRAGGEIRIRIRIVLLCRFLGIQFETRRRSGRAAGLGGGDLGKVNGGIEEVLGRRRIVFMDGSFFFFFFRRSFLVFGL